MKSFARTGFLQNEEGQILPWMAPLMVLVMGLAGLTIDLGRGWLGYRELQASGDAASLAAASEMRSASATVSSVRNKACQYSANDSSTVNNCVVITTGTGGTTSSITQGGNNPAHGIGGNITTVTLSCVSGKAYVVVGCSSSPTGYNVVQVVERASIPTYFVQALNIFRGNTAATSLTMNATSTATLAGSMSPLDVAILLDTTSSMGSSDSTKCGGTSSTAVTKEQCALRGVQALMAQLPQCAVHDPVTNNCIAYNKISLFTFPGVQANTVSAVTNCTGSGTPTTVDYPWPTAPTSSTTNWTAPTGSSGTYQITGFSDDYYGSYNSSTQQNNLSTSSPIVIATGGTGSTTCTGMKTPGGKQTYYAGAINQAQAALMAAAYGTSPQQKMVMIILSDGDAQSTSIASPASSGYGSETNECQQAIAAAQNATALGTTVYTIAYNASTSGCSRDTSNYSTSIQMKGLSPCTTMEYMSSGWPGNKSHFFTDSGSSGSCGTTGYTLPVLFQQIETSFTSGRLIPNV